MYRTVVRPALMYGAEIWALKKAHTGKEVEVVWACDEKRGTLRRKEGDGNESTGGGRKRGRPKRRWLDKVKDDIKAKGLSADVVYDRVHGDVCHRTSTPYKSGNMMKEKKNNQAD